MLVARTAIIWTQQWVFFVFLFFLCSAIRPDAIATTMTITAGRRFKSHPFWCVVLLSSPTINPHRCALEAAAQACPPQVGIRLGAGAVPFSVCHCLSTAVIHLKKKKNGVAVPVEKAVDSWEIKWNNNFFLKIKGRRLRETENIKMEEWAQRILNKNRHRTYNLGLWVTIFTKICIETKALSPSCAFSMNYTSPPPTPSFLIKWLQLHLSIRSSPLQRLDKGLLSVAC